MSVVASIRQRPAVGMALATGVSRATGLARTVALASALGVTALGDAYNTANTVPNMVFTLVAGGVLTSAVVPILVKGRMRDVETQSASALLGLTCAVGAVVSIALVLAAPLVVKALTLGARNRPDYAAFAGLTTTWLRLFAPQVGLYAISVLAVSIMSARRRLVLGAAAPIATNLVTIAAAVAFIRRARGGAPGIGGVDTALLLILGAGTTVAVAAMTAIQLWGAIRSCPGLRPRWRPGHEAVRQLNKVAGWMLLYVSANQLGLAVVIALASATPGAVTAYQWAFTVMQLPYALVAVSVMSAAFPSISRAAQGGGSLTDAVAPSAATTLRLVIPAAAGLWVLASPLAVTLVGEPNSRLVSAALLGFAGSLVPFSLFQLLTRACYAGHDTKSPALVNIAVNVVNVVVALLLLARVSSPAGRLTALAASHALSYVTGAALLGLILERRTVLRPLALLAGQRRTLLATTAMIAVMWPVGRLFDPPSTRAGAMAMAVALAAAGLGVYRLLGPDLRGNRQEIGF